MLEKIRIPLNDVGFRLPSDAEWLFFLTYALATIACCFIIPSENLPTFLLHVCFLSVSVLLVFLSDLSENDLFGFVLFALGIGIFGFLMAFRNLTGIDDSVYEHAYLFIADGRYQDVVARSDMEKGYLFLNYLISLFCGTNYYAAQTIICYMSFAFWSVAIWMYRGKCNLAMMLLLLWSNYYFFVLYAGLIRIFIALPLALIAFNMVAKGRLKTFLGLILFASVFHRSVLILLLMVPLFNEAVLKQWMKFVVAAFFAIPIVFLSIAKILVPILGARYAGYGELGAFSVSVGKFDMLPLWAIGVYFFQFVDGEHRKEYAIGMILISLSMIFSIWSSVVPLGRLIFYANLGVLIIAANIFKQKPVGFVELFAPCIFVVYSFFYVMHCSFLNPVSIEYLFPYESYLAWDFLAN